MEKNRTEEKKIDWNFPSFLKELVFDKRNKDLKQPEIVNCLLIGSTDPFEPIEPSTVSKYVNGSLKVKNDILLEIKDCSTEELCDRVNEVLLVNESAKNIIELIDSRKLKLSESEALAFRELYSVGKNDELVVKALLLAIYKQENIPIKKKQPAISKTDDRVISGSELDDKESNKDHDKGIITFFDEHKVAVVIGGIAFLLFISLLVFFTIGHDNSKLESSNGKGADDILPAGETQEVNTSGTLGIIIPFESDELPESSINISSTETVESAQIPSSTNLQEEAANDSYLPVIASFKWASLADSSAFMGTKVESRFEDFYLYVGDAPDSAYKEDAVLLAYLQNREDHEIIIDECTIQINAIQENKEPYLSVYCSFPYGEDVAPEEDGCKLSLYNSGWGRAERVTVKFKGLRPQILGSEDTELISPDKFLKPGAVTELTFDNIGPGEWTNEIILFYNNQLLVDELTGSYGDWFYAVFEIVLENGDTLETELDDMWYLSSYSNRMQIVYEWELGHGPGEEDTQPVKQYACVIDTAVPNFSHTFPTSQVIHAGSYVALPICIAPIRSCSMSVTISFHFLGSSDKELLTTPTEYLEIFVPNYHGEKNIVDGSSDEWKDLKDNFIVFFPYVTY